MHPMSLRPHDIRDLTLFEFDLYAKEIERLVEASKE